MMGLSLSGATLMGISMFTPKNIHTPRRAFTSLPLKFRQAADNDRGLDNRHVRCRERLKASG